MDSSGMGFLHHTEGAMRLRADFGRGNLWLSPGLQPDIYVRDDVTRLAPLRPTLVLAVAAPFTPFFQPAQDNALALRGREDPHDLIVAAPRPDDPVRARALHAIYRPAPRDQHVARHDDDALHRHDIHVLGGFGVDVLGAGVPSCAARETQRGREDKQMPFHLAHLLMSVVRSL